MLKESIIQCFWLKVDWSLNMVSYNVAYVLNILLIFSGIYLYSTIWRQISMSIILSFLSKEKIIGTPKNLYIDEGQCDLNLKESTHTYIHSHIYTYILIYVYIHICSYVNKSNIFKTRRAISFVYNSTHKK